MVIVVLICPRSGNLFQDLIGVDVSIGIDVSTGVSVTYTAQQKFNTDK